MGERGRQWRARGRAGSGHEPGRTVGWAGNPTLAQPLNGIKLRIENRNETNA
jgi:hypothetical protein